MLLSRQKEQEVKSVQYFRGSAINLTQILSAGTEGQP